MNISHLMVHAQQFEESRINSKNKFSKRVKSYDGGSSEDVVNSRNLDSKRGTPIKFHPNFPRIVMIGCITLSLKL